MGFSEKKYSVMCLRMLPWNCKQKVWCPQPWQNELHNDKDSDQYIGLDLLSGVFIIHLCLQNASLIRCEDHWPSLAVFQSLVLAETEARGYIRHRGNGMD